MYEGWHPGSSRAGCLSDRLKHMLFYFVFFLLFRARVTVSRFSAKQMPHNLCPDPVANYPPEEKYQGEAVESEDYRVNRLEIAMMEYPS